MTFPSEHWEQIDLHKSGVDEAGNKTEQNHDLVDYLWRLLLYM